MHPTPALKIYIPDATNAECEVASSRFRDNLVAEFQLPFEETDIGTGAGVQAFWTTLTDTWPFVAAAALFFSGKKIEENLEAWHKLFKRLTPFINRGAIFDRDGAAVLAIEGLRLALGKTPDSVRLVGYQTASVLVASMTLSKSGRPIRARFQLLLARWIRFREKQFTFFRLRRKVECSK